MMCGFTEWVWGEKGKRKTKVDNANKKRGRVKSPKVKKRSSETNKKRTEIMERGLPPPIDHFTMCAFHSHTNTHKSVLTNAAKVVQSAPRSTN
jgi:hypothetical protein